MGAEDPTATPAGKRNLRIQSAAYFPPATWRRVDHWYETWLPTLREAMQGRTSYFDFLPAGTLSHTDLFIMPEDNGHSDLFLYHHWE